MTATRTLGEHVAEAVAGILEGETMLAYEVIWERMPHHIHIARPTRKMVIAAIKDANWLPHKNVEGVTVYRAPKLESDPIITRDNAASEQLRELIEQIERLKEERQGISDAIGDKYAEAKAIGFDVVTVKHIEKLRGMDPAHREEADMLIDTYRHAMGLS